MCVYTPRWPLIPVNSLTRRTTSTGTVPMNYKYYFHFSHCSKSNMRLRPPIRRFFNRITRDLHRKSSSCPITIPLPAVINPGKHWSPKSGRLGGEALPLLFVSNLRPDSSGYAPKNPFGSLYSLALNNFLYFI